MSLSTDALLFAIVLLLAGIQSALPVTGGGGQLVVAGLGAAVLGLVGSVAATL